MIFSSVKSIAIPEGNVKAIHSGGNLLWSASGGDIEGVRTLVFETTSAYHGGILATPS